MPQTNTKDRNASLEMIDDCQANARFIWCTRTRRDQNMIRCQCLYACQINLVVAANFHRLTQFTQILNKVVREGIVIIDNQYHMPAPPHLPSMQVTVASFYFILTASASSL
ncbi:hypothetical protein D3C76_1481390 [compost metagenome]